MNIYVTIGGAGTRMKAISPKDKHLLYFKNERIIDIILGILPTAKIIGNNKTNSRKETLEEIRFEKNCLIVDCDIIPLLGYKVLQDLKEDTIFYFKSNKNKYGSLIIENGIVTGTAENKNISENKCSGVYFVKSMNELLNKMTDVNSIASGMLGANTIEEKTFVKLGDLEDYFNAL
jgi:hypothetical protein